MKTIITISLVLLSVLCQAQGLSCAAYHEGRNPCSWNEDTHKWDQGETFASIVPGTYRGFGRFIPIEDVKPDDIRHELMVKSILEMPIEQALALDAVTITCSDIQFFYTDSTLSAHLVYHIDSAGFENTFHDVRRNIDLKQLSVRNALRANPVIRPVLDDTGQFLYNQFTNF